VQTAEWVEEVHPPRPHFEQAAIKTNGMSSQPEIDSIISVVEVLIEERGMNPSSRMTLAVRNRIVLVVIQ